MAKIEISAGRARRAGRSIEGALLAAAAASALACAPAGREPASAPVTTVAVPAPPAEVAAEGTGPDEPEQKGPARHKKVIQGLTEVYIGHSTEEVRRALGPEDKVVSEQAERDAWTASGYDPDEGVVFLLGFDEILVYDTPKAGQTIPFWKLYMRDNRVVFMILTSYGFEGLSLGKIGFPPSCYLLEDAREIAVTFGDGSILVKDGAHGHDTYHYVDQGISVITSGRQIRAFDIYGSLTPAERDRIQRALSAAARKAAAQQP